MLPFSGVREPYAVAVDTAGNVYIADANNTAGHVYPADANNNRVLKLPAGSTSQIELPLTGLKNPSGVAVDIAGNVEEPRLLCTLGPLQALEGGCDIYPELACGSIVYRVADLTSQQQREVTHTVGAATLAALLEQRPPSAVMVGVEPSHFSFLEEPLRNWVPVDWQRLTYDNGLQVYSRP